MELIVRQVIRRHWLPRFVCTVGIVLTACCEAAEPTRYYSIKMQDKLIGSAEVDQHDLVQDGQELTRLRSKTSLKVALLGNERNTLLEFETLVQPSTGRLVRYRMTDTTNELVRHVESDFENETARTWNYRDGQPRGEPVATELPPGTVILGSNNFGHWQLMMDAAKQHVAGDKATLNVFLPDAGEVETFEWVRGTIQETVIAEVTRRCVTWTLPKANLVALVDADSGQFLRLEVPAQQTVIELADANVLKLAQKTQAEELLARHFVQSNVLFDDFMKVRFIKAKLDVTVIGSGVAMETSALNTAMQQFDGEKQDDRITGQVVVRTTPFNPSGSPEFPSQGIDPELESWLQPSAFIESDQPAIRAQAAELTTGAKTRWDAVRKIGDWVHREIAYVIAETPSAELALEKRRGDCGPHSTLMVAMLQASRIPARLVGGLVFTPSFGGSFGQHAWVEVHMGDAGWIAVDPTTGEFESMSATHIKLFEGLGGVIPALVDVVEFEPANASPTGDKFAKPKPLPWELNKTHTFRYTQGEKELGIESFTIKSVEKDGVSAYEMKAKASLKINLLTSITTDTTMVVADNAKPISFSQNLAALLQKVTIACTFEEGLVKQDISGTTNLSREIKLPAGAYCFDNNLMGSWALICSQLELKAGESLQIKTFHPSTMQIIPLTFTPQAPAPIQIGNEQVICFECDVAPIKNTFWISQDGRFVRAKQGDLVIEWVPSVTEER